MEKELYGILRKHKLPLKKREEMMVDLLNLFSVMCCEKIDYKKLRTVIIENYEGVKEIDNGESRNDWKHEDFTDKELIEIAEDIINDYKQ